MPFTFTIRNAHGRACPWCGDRMTCSPKNRAKRPSRDHLVPRMRGGTVGPQAIVCYECNNLKGTRSLDQFLSYCYATDDGKRVRHISLWMDLNTLLVEEVRSMERVLARYAIGSPQRGTEAQHITS